MKTMDMDIPIEPMAGTYPLSATAQPCPEALHDTVWLTSHDLVRDICPGLREIVEMQLAIIQTYNRLYWEGGHPNKMLIPQVVMLDWTGYPQLSFTNKPAYKSPILKRLGELETLFLLAWKSGARRPCSQCGLPGAAMQNGLWYCSICIGYCADIHPTDNTENGWWTSPSALRSGDYRTWTPERDRIEDKLDGDDDDEEDDPLPF